MGAYVSVSFILYLLLMLGIGIYFSHKTVNLGDYYLGGRRMGKWVVALSAQASDMSGWLLMGLPGAIYLSGLSESWIGIGLAVGTYLNWRFVARPLRRFSHAYGDAITIPDFLSNRFHDPSGVVRMVSAFIILAFFLFYTASGFVACAKLFATTFGMPYDWALVLGAFVIVSYTLMGGFSAVCWTDVIQGSIMFFAIAAVPVACVINAGGVSETLELIKSVNANLSQLKGADINLMSFTTSAATGESIGAIAMISCLAWGLGYFGMPHILVRFMSIDNEKNIAASRRIATTWVLVSLAAAVLVGLLGHVYVAKTGVDVDDSEKIFMLMIKGLFHPILIGILMSAILAAIMSTADSQLLVSASAFVNDFYKATLRRNASTRELVWASRLTVAGVAILAAILASQPESDFVKAVMKLVSFAWGGFGAAFGPIILLALFWRRTTLAGAVSGMIAGAATTFIWKFWLNPMAAKYPVFGIYELAPGFAICLLVAVGVSLAGKPPSNEALAEFDRIAKE